MLGLASDAEQLHIGHMKKSPRVTFKMFRIAEDDWQIVAECQGIKEQSRCRRVAGRHPPYSLAALARVREMTNIAIVWHPEDEGQIPSGEAPGCRSIFTQ
jgi:hypothetical protein